MVLAKKIFKNSINAERRAMARLSNQSYGLLD